MEADPRISGKRDEPLLSETALERTAATLADQFALLYDAPPLDPRASLTANILTFVFEGGLSPSDEWLLKKGLHDKLNDFRVYFMKVVSAQLDQIVNDLLGVTVTSSFFGFDPTTRTTISIFVLDLGRFDQTHDRRAVLNWSEQVRRNARNLREDHVAARQANHDLAKEMRTLRERIREERGARVDPSDGDSAVT
jgi:uncharacterized protein YbcI